MNIFSNLEEHVMSEAALHHYLECINKDLVLIETKTFQQARERTYLSWPIGRYPCRMKMKEAGWLIFRNNDNQFIAVCLYCHVAFKDWNHQHDPYQVHRTLSPTCSFILYHRTLSIPSSPIVKRIPRHEKVRPSSHSMAILPHRIASFEQCSSVTLPHSFETLAEFGLFLTGQNSWIECFSCQRQIPILNIPNNLMAVHTNQCKYAQHLKNHSQRSPLHIQASKKIYQLDNQFLENTTLYFLRCVSPSSTRGILLSAQTILPNDQQPEQTNAVFKQLQSTLQSSEINYLSSCDGPLVHVLKDLANNWTNFRTLPDDQPCLFSGLPILTTNLTNGLSFQCKTCLNYDASPHLVSIKCSHLGLCSQECFSKWMTCVVCGYTLGKVVRIYAV